jgi:hypothetical protein
MNVYVESNFVLEQALEQEQCESCQELIGIASAGSIRLVVPAFSLAEPHIALMRRGNERSRLSAELQKHLSELGRSKTYREVSGNFSEFDDPNVREMLDEFGCKFFGRFDDGLRYIQARLRKEG